MPSGYHKPANFLRAVFLWMSALLASTQVCAQENAGLEQWLAPEEYRAMGLDKLTPRERDRLSRWIAAKLEAADAAPPADFGFPEPAPDPIDGADELRARVLPPFRGWNGKTVFHLDNGQVWQQRVSGRYTYLGEDTRVAISKNRLGFFEMRLLAADRAVGVKRLR